MALKDTYVFDNRYGDLIRLIKTDIGYLLDGDLDYMRICYEQDNKTINFIDPSGGPLLQVGAKWPEFEIEAIERIGAGYILKLKENVLN